MRVLGIETSCDETGVAVYDGSLGLMAHEVYSQVALHAPFGGVVPELASRDHVRKLAPLVRHVLGEAGLTPADLHGVAYTAGPGLIGALLVGAGLARSLAYGLNIPAVAVHHLEGHLLAPLLDTPDLRPPFVALLVSGGHTQLVGVEALGRYRLLGETLDDAAGEAFDKVAQLLGFGYPGGPRLAQWAERGRAGRYRFPRPMTDRPGLDFSFSGLKTYTLNTLDRVGSSDQDKADIARAFQEAVIDTLVIKCRRAMQHTGARALVISGGVSANVRLREKMEELAADQGFSVYFPPLQWCTDNGAMIAFAGYLRLRAGQQAPLAFNARPRWQLTDLPPVDSAFGA